jgi:hypothetical protein
MAAEVRGEQGDGRQAASSSATPEKKLPLRVKLPSFEEVDAVVKQRKSGRLSHIDLTRHEAEQVSEHLSAFKKSAKMRQAALALYINTQAMLSILMTWCLTNAALMVNTW